MDFKHIRKQMGKIHPAIRNPYMIAIVLFAIWMIFIDENNMIVQYRRYTQLKDLTDKKTFYLQQIKITNQQFAELTNNPESQEKFAREKYRMKRDNEDVFVIVQE